MRYLTLTAFLALIMGFAGCGDMADDNGAEAGAGTGAAPEMTMEAAPAEEPAAMDMEETPEDSSPPQWQVLEQNVVHPGY